jgi:hypothetical protein
MDGELSEMLDDLVGSEYAALAFMVQLSIELALAKPDPEAWARKFVTEMHERLTEHEKKARDGGADEQINEKTHGLAHTRIDLLGRYLGQVLARRR